MHSGEKSTFEMSAHTIKQSSRSRLQGRLGKTSRTLPSSALVEGKKNYKTSSTHPAATPALQSAHHLEDKNLSLG